MSDSASTESTTIEIQQTTAPKIVRSFWHDGVDVSSGHRSREALSIYTGSGGEAGEGEVRTPHLHVVVENLFDPHVTAGMNHIEGDVDLVFDVMGATRAALAAMQDDNDTESVELSDWMTLSATVDLGDSGAGRDLSADQDTHELSGLVTWEGTVGGQPISDDVTVTVQSMPGFDRLARIVIPMPIAQEAIGELSDGTDLRLGAWTWIRHDAARALYDALDEGVRKEVDVETREGRTEFLKSATTAEQLSFLGVAWSGFDSNRDTQRDREEDPAGEGTYLDDDGFHYDEPTRNGIRVRKALPVTSFFVGSQLGDIGLCNDNQLSYYGNSLTGSILSPSVVDDVFFINAGTPRSSSTPTHRFVEFDSSGGVASSSLFPTVHAATDDEIQLRSDVDAGDDSFPINELQTTGESLYLFREESAAAWVNSIETWIDAGRGGSPRSHEETLQPVYRPREASDGLPFSTDADRAAFSIIGIDRCIDYADRVGGLRPLAGWFMLEQRRLDLAACASLSVVGEQDLETKDGRFVARIGKGLPETPFISPTHTKAYVDFDDAGSVWQCHPYCHRPVFISYTLERDLTQDEIDAWNASPPDIAGRIRTPDEQVAHLPLPIEDPAQAKEGVHVRLLYLTSAHSIEFEIQPKALFESPGPDSWLESAWDAMMAYPATYEPGNFNGQQATQEFSTLRPVEDGLFAGSPVISADYLTLPEIREEQLSSLRRQYGLKEAQIKGSFLLSLVPYGGDAASATFESLMEFAGEGSMKRFPETGAAILSTILGSALGKKSVFGKTVVEGLGTTKGAFTMLRRVGSTLEEISTRLQNWASPFRLGRDGLQPKDAVVLMAGERRWRRLTCTADGIECTHDRVVGDIAVVYDRTVDPGNVGSAERPYHIPMGPVASRIERGDGADAARKANSIAEPMDAFLTAVRETERMAEARLGGQQMQKPEHDARLRQIAETLSQPGHQPALNPNLSRFLHDGAVLESLSEGPTPEDGSVSDADAFHHLWQSIDLSITRCPACERLMDPNWGWCPYHADPTFFKKNREDVQPTEKSFQRFIQDDPNFNQNLDIVDHLSSPLDKDTRLFVHWTEFEVFRRATTPNDE